MEAQRPTSEVFNALSGNVDGAVVQARDIVHHHHAAAPTALDALPALSAVAPGFTGRSEELVRVLAVLDPSPGTAGDEVVVSVVTGMGGVGKTALAVAAAHASQERGWFSATLFVNLRGYDADPVTPDQALEALLRALGVDPVHIPASPEERAGLYRSRLAAVAQQRGGPVLVVADNAARVTQVRALLPGGGGHRLLVTSRSRLDTLSAAHCVVNALFPAAAVHLLGAVVARADSADARARDTAGLERIAAACGYLPLALQVCAALLVRSRRLSLARLADRLADTATRLDHLDDGERAVRAAFDLSYARLTAEQARVFTLLGIAPGVEVSTDVAAVLAGTSADEVGEVLAELAAAHLVTEDEAAEADRWRMHDLLADYARHRAAEIARDPELAVTHEAALRRVLDYYTAMAGGANEQLRVVPGQENRAASSGPDDVFSDRREALAWLDAERAALVPAVEVARTSGHTTAAIQLPLALVEYLGWQRFFTDQITVATIACTTAHHIGDHHSEAMAWHARGVALREARWFDEAIAACERARDLFVEVGDRHGAAQAWNSLGSALRRVGRVEEAIGACQHARALHREANDVRGEAMACNTLGSALREARRVEEAIAACERARDLFVEVGDRHGEAMAWNSLGLASSWARQSAKAVTSHQHARVLHHETGDRHGEAIACNSLGGALRRMGRVEEAIDAYQHACVLHQEMNNVGGEAGAWRSLGFACYDLGRWRDAVNALERAAGLYADTGDTQRRATIQRYADQAREAANRSET